MKRLHAFVLVALVLAIAVGALLSGCASLGVGPPVGRAIPLQVKEGGELGTCASGGYEVDFAPLTTVASLTSLCVRPYRPRDGGAASSAADVLVSEFEDGGTHGD